MNFEQVNYDDNKPLYQQVSEIIERKIIDRKIPVGFKIPPQAELSKTFGVSLDTVKLAIGRLMKSGYLSGRRKIGTIVINNQPKNSDSTPRNTICLVVCTGPIKRTFEDLSFYELINAIEAAAGRNKINLLYRTLDGKSGVLFVNGNGEEVAGLIVAGSITPGDLQIIKRTHKPFVLIGDVYSNGNRYRQADVLCTDDFRNAYIATRYLTKLGSRKILYFANYLSKYPVSREMLEGYKSALEESGIKFKKELLVEINSGAYRETNKFLEQCTEKLDGLVCVNLSRPTFDSILKAFEEAGIEKPGNMIAVTSDHLQGIPAVECNMDEIGGKAVERLLERFENPARKPERILVQAKMTRGK